MIVYNIIIFMKSPEVITTTESVSHGNRMILEQEGGKGAIFVVEYDKNRQGLNIYWPANRNPESVKHAVEEIYGEEVRWSEKGKRLTGELQGKGYFWFDPMYEGYVPRAGVRLTILTDEDALEKIASLVPKTTIDNIKLPADLGSRLKQFVAELPKPTK